jgi:hypothetical protein
MNNNGECTSIPDVAVLFGEEANKKSGNNAKIFCLYTCWPKSERFIMVNLIENLYNEPQILYMKQLYFIDVESRVCIANNIYN